MFFGIKKFSKIDNFGIPDQISMETMAKEAITLLEEQNVPSNGNFEMEIFEEIPKLLGSHEPKSIEKWLHKVANGILCSEKFKFKNFELDRFGKIHGQFCANLAAGMNMGQAMNGLENEAKILAKELYLDPKVQEQIQMAKNYLASGAEMSKKDKIMDQIHLGFEQLVQTYQGH